ncbi:hypothetical protein CA13_13680 [Planctomycetes bacterium CA13]|uniref:Uncharacterized protein n=1 Tax=Novipirellula herctigrandis TaxID=2527986 RepID=A0A5C5YZB1_9BACT|nr:hypothetical protein CA13_13680 [Planctomycetes bacterium CA13]
MITSTCPRCSELFRLPSADVPPDATAQCPWCGEIYPASEIVNQLPPMVQLISVDGQPLFTDETPAAAGFVDTSAAGVGGLAAVSAAGIGDETLEDVNETVFDKPSEDIDETWTDGSEKTVADVSGFQPENVASTEFESDSLEIEEFGEDVESPEGMELSEGDRFQESPVDLDGAVHFDGEEDEESADDWNLELADSGARDSTMETDDELAFADATVQAGTVAPMNVRPRTKKKSSPIKTLLGYVAGFFIALPLAGGLLLAIGKPLNLGFWPFDGTVGSGASMTRSAAPVVSSTPAAPNNSRPSVPLPPGTSGGLGDGLQAVTDQLAELSNDGQDAVDSTAGTSDEALAMPSEYLASDDPNLNPSANGEVAYPPSAEPAEPESGEVESGEVEPGETAAAVEEVVDENSKSMELALPKGYDETNLPSNVASTLESLAYGDVETEPTVPSLDLPDASAVLDVDEAKPPVIDIKPAKVVASESTVDKAVTGANTLLGSLLNYEGAEKGRRSLLARSYAAVAALGAESGAGESENVERLLDDLGRSPLSKDLGDAANLWLDYSKRNTEGVLLIGRTGANTRGTVIRINTPSGDERPVVVTGQALPPSDRVIALGRILDSGDGQTVDVVAVKELP